MVLDESNQSLIADLAHAIERQIVQRTWGRVHRLEVEVTDDRIVVHGYTQSYHGKQLALEGARDVVGNSAHVELDVEVGPRSTVYRACRQSRAPSAAGLEEELATKNFHSTCCGAIRLG
jgi:hypothetical protein